MLLFFILFSTLFPQILTVNLKNNNYIFFWKFNIIRRVEAKNPYHDIAMLFFKCK